jgi:hypothetical protein
VEAKRVLILSPFVALLLLLPGQAVAYDDGLEGAPHGTINSLAIKMFETQIMPADKYLKNASLNGFSTAGIAWDASDGSRWTPPEIAVQRTKSLKQWIIDGGYSADEPEATMALAHFYDPKAAAGQRYLTDQQFLVNFVSHYNSEYANPGIDAVQWAFHGENWGTAFDQKYSWANGKDYLTQALASLDAGNVSYGKAWRSLGETMHLVADMTVPAHVRNDGHAKALGDPDPYESSTTGQLVSATAGYPPAPLDYSQSPEQLMIRVADYVNTNFLSQDTIPLPPGITSPWHKYALPSLDGLTPSSNGYLHRTINGRDVRIAKTRSLWSKLFGTGQQFYMIDSNVVDDQRTILIPTAIKADEMLVSKFLPRFNVTEKVVPAENGYTMVGGISGVWSSEWPAIRSAKVRNGARIMVTDAKTGATTKIQVKLIDPSKDFSSFSYGFKADPGDSVRLEFDVGGYVVRSSTIKVAASGCPDNLNPTDPMYILCHHDLGTPQITPGRTLVPIAISSQTPGPF